MVADGFVAGSGGGDVGGEDDGWLRTGGLDKSQEARVRDVRTLDEAGEAGEREEEEEIPDMEDEDDDEEAIIRETKKGNEAYVHPPNTPSHTFAGINTDPPLTRPLRTYNLYITYTPFYRTPRLYLSGYLSTSTPLPPHLMMEDIVGDYADKTVTLEDFPFFEHGVKMASVHPCKHASVMKVLLGRADAALKLRLQKIKTGQQEGGKGGKVESGMEGLVDEMNAVTLAAKPTPKDGFKAGTAAAGGAGGDEWEVLQHEAGEGEDEVAIRVDQYLVVFIKFAATLAPAIEQDFTMGV